MESDLEFRGTSLRSPVIICLLHFLHAPVTLPLLHCYCTILLLSNYNGNGRFITFVTGHLQTIAAPDAEDEKTNGTQKEEKRRRIASVCLWCPHRCHQSHVQNLTLKKEKEIKGMRN